MRLRRPHLRAVSASIVFTAIALNLSAAAVLYAQPNRIDPIARGACSPVELGRMTGTLTRPVLGGAGERFGADIHPLGDIDGDGLADWLVSHVRIDTAIRHREGYLASPIELLMYKGVRGGLPQVGSAVRLGPTELGSKSTFLACGDFDNDGHQDIVVRQLLFADTTEGNSDGKDIADVVVYWGSPGGAYSPLDTSRLSAGAPKWFGPEYGTVADLSHDGIDDLILHSRWGAGYADGSLVRIANMNLFLGADERRWGRGTTPSLPAWNWWNTPQFASLRVVDHDGDGALDIAAHEYYWTGSLGSVGVLYGNADGLPDTLEAEYCSIKETSGNFSLFQDITGDHIPELLTNNFTVEKIKVFIGIRGQRLLEQFGSGDDPPVEGAERWWGRPWAEVPMPYRLHNGWSGVDTEMFDFGDFGRDGLPDIVVYSAPFLLGYGTGRNLDSLADMTYRLPMSWRRSAANLGDIDGSGRPTMAIGYDSGDDNPSNVFPGGIVFIKPNRCAPNSGRQRKLPAGTDTPTSRVEVDSAIEGTIPHGVRYVPGGDGRDALLRWPAGPGIATLSIADVRGRIIRRWTVSNLEGLAEVDDSALIPGFYVLNISAPTYKQSFSLIVR